MVLRKRKNNIFISTFENTNICDYGDQAAYSTRTISYIHKSVYKKLGSDNLLKSTRKWHILADLGLQTKNLII